jgi:hypothetical protein
MDAPSVAVHFFQQGVAGATEDPTNQEQRTFWAEAAKLLGKSGPPPVH